MRVGHPRAAHWLRRGIQGSFLALFVLAAWAATYPPSGAVNENLFLRVDPLAAFAAARASGLWLYLLPAWLLLGLTVFSGRFFCGWICPLGSLLEVLPSLGRRRAGSISRLRPRDIAGRTIGKGDTRLRLKYLFLAVLILLFLFGVNALWIFDPLVVANRAAVFVFAGAAPVMFMALVALAVTVGPRFWCQEMCPLGACLSAAGMVGSRLPERASPLALVKHEDACIHCGRCSLACPFGIVEVAESDRTGRLTVADCALCGECVSACPSERALSLRAFGFSVLSSGRRGESRRERRRPESALSEEGNWAGVECSHVAKDRDGWENMEGQAARELQAALCPQRFGGPPSSWSLPAVLGTQAPARGERTGPANEGGARRAAAPAGGVADGEQEGGEAR